MHVETTSNTFVAFLLWARTRQSPAQRQMNLNLPSNLLFYFSVTGRSSSFSPPFTLGHENQACASEENTLDWLHNLQGPNLLSYRVCFNVWNDFLIAVSFMVGDNVVPSPCILPCSPETPTPTPLLFPPPIPCGLVQQFAYSTTITKLRVEDILFLKSNSFFQILLSLYTWTKTISSDHSVKLVIISDFHFHLVAGLKFNV